MTNSTPTIDKPATETKKALPPFVSVIFSPAKIRRNIVPNVADEISGISAKELMRCGQHYQVVDNKPGKPGEAVLVESFFLHPGTNLGIHRLESNDDETIDYLSTNLWLRANENPINQSYLYYNDPLIPGKPLGNMELLTTRRKFPQGYRYEAIQVFLPAVIDDLEEPGYRNFDDDAALALVQATMHEKWIDRYLVGEKRSFILGIANQQKEKIVSIRKARLNDG